MNLLDKPTGLAKFLPPEPEPPPLNPPPSIYGPDGKPRLPQSAGSSNALDSLDVASELATAYQHAKRLAEAAEFDLETPLNQKAQIVNSLNTLLASITRSRSEIYSAERNRAMEAALLNTLKKYPEVQKDFMAGYKVALEKLK